MTRSLVAALLLLSTAAHARDPYRAAADRQARFLVRAQKIADEGRLRPSSSLVKIGPFGAGKATDRFGKERIVVTAGKKQLPLSGATDGKLLAAIKKGRVATASMKDAAERYDHDQKALRAGGWEALVAKHDLQHDGGYAQYDSARHAVQKASAEVQAEHALTK